MSSNCCWFNVPLSLVEENAVAISLGPLKCMILTKVQGEEVAMQLKGLGGEGKKNALKFMTCLAEILTVQEEE